jgi:hypothetical protein
MSVHFVESFVFVVGGLQIKKPPGVPAASQQTVAGCHIM